MSKVSKPWLRGAVSLAILVGLGAALVASPAGAHFLHPSKGQVKKVAKKEATKVFNQKIGPATAPFQTEADLMYATVNNAGAAGATLVHGRGVTAVIPFVATIVEFNQTVTDCTATATYAGNPTNDTFASVEYSSTNPNHLIVWLIDDTGALVSGTGEMFHLIVVCP